jgi:hypothetical protein
VGHQHHVEAIQRPLGLGDQRPVPLSSHRSAGRCSTTSARAPPGRRPPSPGAPASAPPAPAGPGPAYTRATACAMPLVAPSTSTRRGRSSHHPRPEARAERRVDERRERVQLG